MIKLTGLFAAGTSMNICICLVIFGQKECLGAFSKVRTSSASPNAAA